MSRWEKDCLGQLELGDSAYYGVHTRRGILNFNGKNGVAVHGRNDISLIHAMVLVKKAVAYTNRKCGNLEEGKARAIISACDRIMTGDFDNQFQVSAYQGGAGTTTHMNVNEVIANVALESMGHEKGQYEFLSPFDDVNKGQSTNDVYPTALRIACIEKVRFLSDSMAALQESLQKKESEFADVRKLGRTQLMDALPVTLGEEFGAYAQAISRDRWRIYKVEERLRQVNLGGTAVGTGMNADLAYRYMVIDTLRELTGFGLARAEYPMDLTQNNDVFVEVSGLLKAAAVNLMKISNDLRLMNSGPKGGLGEICLELRQAGSTIMPGKIIPEMVTQIAMRVMANDSGIAFAAASGQLELNAFMPFISYSLLESLDLLGEASEALRANAIETVRVNKAGCLRHLEASLESVTSLVPEIGYEKASELAMSERKQGDKEMDFEA